MNQLEYKRNATITPEQVSDVFRKSGIRRPVEDLERIGRMIQHADETITVWEGPKLIGILRAITDYAYCCYISDLAVDAAYQKLGIGRDLIQALMDRLGNEEIQYILLSAPGAVAFYERIGMERADKAFIVRRQKHT